MFQKKLLILLFKLTTIINILLIGSCMPLYKQQYQDLVYIDNFKEITGMIIRKNLLSYFPKQDKKSSKYHIIINDQSLSEDLYLTTSEGLASRGELILKVSWSIIETSTGKIFYTLQSEIKESYNISNSSFSTLENKRIAENYLSKQIANDMKTNIYIILNRLNYNENSS